MNSSTKTSPKIEVIGLKIFAKNLDSVEQLLHSKGAIIINCDTSGKNPVVSAILKNITSEECSLITKELQKEAFYVI